MIVRKSERAIRSDWMNHPDAGGLILNADLGVIGTNLKAKLLVFRNRTCLKRFWDKALGRKQSGWPAGVVSELGCEVIRFRKGKPDLHIHEVDPKYYCVIGLVKGWLTMEVICHEAVHAAYNFAKRIKKTPWDHCKKELEEEEICYPAGKIASEINRVLHDQGLYD